MWHPVGLNPRPLHSPRLCSPVKRKQGTGEQRGEKGEERFKWTDKVCGAVRGKDFASGGKVKKKDYKIISGI